MHRIKSTNHLRFSLILLTLSAFALQLQAQMPWNRPLAPGEEQVSIICYNVLNGFTDDDEGIDRPEAFVEWVKEKDPEIMALQELTGFTQAKLEKLAKSYGHPYALILKESGYAVGLTSKKPIKLKKRMIEGMHHGALHARTYGIDMIVVHLSPFDWRVRLRESRKICRYVEDQKLERYMVMGDFNAQSPFDADLLDTKSDLLQWMKEYDQKHTSTQLHRDGAFDYSVLSTYLAMPMEDPAQLFVAPERRATNPTRIWKRNKPVEKDGNRIDYILVSYNLLKDCVAAPILQDHTTDYLSDHYPVGLDIVVNSDAK